MHRKSLAALLCLGVALLPSAGSATAPAATPTFDCTKAKGDVQRLICSDPSLARLDAKLAAAYRAASAAATGPLAKRLRAEQRGWVKGRDDCWKATQKTWITASWTVDSVKACVDAQYRLRTSELQAVWRLLPARTVLYACQDTPANEVVATFFETDPRTLRLERGDTTTTLWRVPASGEGAFEGRNVSAVERGPGLEVSWLDTNSGKTDVLQCRAK